MNREIREIRFRVWDGVKIISLSEAWKQEQIYIDLSEGFKNNTLEVNYEGVELMQYTGLKDKNSKEIYCGDIVKFHIDVGYGPEEVIASVIYKDCGFQYDSKAGCDYMRGFDDVEVIGNIYENQELYYDSK